MCIDPPKNSKGKRDFLDLKSDFVSEDLDCRYYKENPQVLTNILLYGIYTELRGLNDNFHIGSEISK